MEAVAHEEVEMDIEEKKVTRDRRIVSITDPFKAFQVISGNADLDYIKKLNKLLNGLVVAMEE